MEESSHFDEECAQHLNMKKLDRFSEAAEIWKTKTAARDLPSELVIDLETHKRLLNVFSVGDYYFYIFNVKEVRLEFISDSVNTILGKPEGEWSIEQLFRSIHPEDIPVLIENEKKVAAFFSELPPEELMNYKASYDLRVRKSDGSYIRILMQIVVLESDRASDILKAFVVHTDITHIKNSGPSTLAFIGLNGRPSGYPGMQNEPATPRSLLTPRESELLPMIMNGMTSFQIAEALHISRHTVDTHRRKMLQKTKSSSLTEMVGKAIREGWI